MSEHTTRAQDPQRAGTAGDRKRTREDWRTWGIGALLVCLFLGGVGVAYATDAARDATKAVEEVRAIEVKDRNTNRNTAYRLCSRNAVDRAFAHSSVRRNLARAQGEAAADAAVRELQRPDVLPILNCKPNLVGKGAAPMTPAQQHEFVRRWELHRLSAEERGVCPGSRVGPRRPGDC
jgi:hypothetical protein